MSYSIIPTPRFKKEVKRLSKRYASLKTELARLEQSLQQNPAQGTPLGNNTFKIRIAIKSKGKGKSGGGRVITNVFLQESEVYLLSIYDKSEISSIDNKTLKNLVAEVILSKKQTTDKKNE